MKCDALTCENNCGTGYCDCGGPVRIDENGMCVSYFPIINPEEGEDATGKS